MDDEHQHPKDVALDKENFVKQLLHLQQNMKGQFRERQHIRNQPKTKSSVWESRKSSNVASHLKDPKILRSKSSHSVNFANSNMQQKNPDIFSPKVGKSAKGFSNAQNHMGSGSSFLRAGTNQQIQQQSFSNAEELSPTPIIMPSRLKQEAEKPSANEQVEEGKPRSNVSRNALNSNENLVLSSSFFLVEKDHNEKGQSANRKHSTDHSSLHQPKAYPDTFEGKAINIETQRRVSTRHDLQTQLGENSESIMAFKKSQHTPVHMTASHTKAAPSNMSIKQVKAPIIQIKNVYGRELPQVRSSNSNASSAIATLNRGSRLEKVASPRSQAFKHALPRRSDRVQEIQHSKLLTNLSKSDQSSMQLICNARFDNNLNHVQILDSNGDVTIKSQKDLLLANFSPKNNTGVNLITNSNSMYCKLLPVNPTLKQANLLSQRRYFYVNREQEDQLFSQFDKKQILKVPEKY